ncbi:zinc-binding dehydrogenase [Sorangium sp. So ce118]
MRTQAARRTRRREARYGSSLIVNRHGPGEDDARNPDLEVGAVVTAPGPPRAPTRRRWQRQADPLYFGSSLRVAGIHAGSAAMFESLNRAIAVSRMRPVVDKVFALVEARATCDYLASAKHVGKVAIRG